MKRFLQFLFSALFITTMSLSASSQQIINENFDSYEAGTNMATANSSQWQTWGSGVLGGEISADQAHSGANAMKVYINGSTETDVILKLNDLSTGRYKVEFYMYVPTAKTGYYNMLQDFNEANSLWGIQVTLNGGTGKVDANGSQYTFQYAHGEWIKFVHFVDLDNDWIEMYVNDQSVVSYQWSKGTEGDGTTCKLDAMDFYSHTENNQKGEYYIDDLVIENVAAPAAPSQLSANVTGENNNDVALTWTHAQTEGLVHFVICRNGAEIATTSETQYTDINLYPARYDYQVRAYYGNNLGQSAATNTASVSIDGGVERENVLLEYFSYVRCGYCTYLAKALDQIEAAGNLNLFILDHHISQGLDFYYAQSASRMGYWAGRSNEYDQVYDFSGTPSYVFDGYYGVGGLITQNNTELKTHITTFYNAVKDINSIYNLTAELTNTGERTYTLNVEAEKLSEFFGNDQVTVIAALSEDINYSWLGYNKLHNVVRAMYPNFVGKTATFDENNKFATTFTISVPDDYDIAKCKVTVWVENHTKGRVMQSLQFKLSEIELDVNDYTSNNFSVYPNPSNNIFTINAENIQSIEVYDITGKLVMQENINNNIATIDLSNYAKGVYTLKAVANNTTKVSKLVLE